ncbi:unnamed protein product [Amaranthus hypochondriacus]
MANSDNETFAQKLWKKHKGQAIYSQYTPFIISLAAGNLPLETFEGYLYQDIHYLAAYAQAAYIAQEYAEDTETKQKLQNLGDDTILYIESYASFFQELGLEYKPGSVPKNEATISYIDFLLSAARTKVTVYTFAAMTPCERLYAYLGWEVKNTLTPEQLNANKYKRWIEENSSEPPEPRKRRNLRSAENMEYFINKLSAGLPQEELDKIEEYYKKGLEHETEFFLAQEIVGQEVVVPLWKQLQGFKFPLVSNFDLCCTKSSIDSEKLQVYEQGIASQLLKNTPPGEYNFAAIQKAFALVSNLEKTSFPKDVSFGEFQAKSDSINFILKVLQKDYLDASAYVISTYWSDDTIISALTKEGLEGKISHAGNKGLVESSIDKLEAFIDILKKNDNQGKNLSLFIGDSVGDLPCLLKSDIGGIIIGSYEELIKVGQHFLVSFVPLFKGLIDKQREYKKYVSLSSWKPNPGVIYTFTYWAEIEAFIFVGS